MSDITVTVTDDTDISLTVSPGADLSSSTTDNLNEGTTNLYHTSERVDDRVNSLLVAGSNVTLTYDDTANTLTVAAATTDDLSDNDTDDLSEGSTNLYYTDARVDTALTTVGGHILPAADDTHDLGSPTKQWRELYLGPTSLYVDGVQLISRTADIYDFTTDSGQDIRLKPAADLFLSPTSGNVRVASGNVNVEGGDVTLTTGDLTATSGNVTAGANVVANAVLTDLISDAADIRIETGSTSFLHADTGNVYIGTDLAQTVHITSTEVKGVGTNPNISANNLTVGGTVSGIDTDDVGEGSTNLYYTDARADARIANNIIDEDNFATDSATRAPSQQSTKAYIAAQIQTKDQLSELSGDTDDVAEGSTNLYYTDARAQAVSINNVVEDTTPQLGGNLDLNSNNITGTGNIDTTGTLSLTNTTTDDTVLLTTTEDTSTAAPVLTFKRNSASPADGDYLGQLKFKGENDADQEVVYAKVTGKISDATDTTEDGLIEFALRKAGANNIGMRLTSTDLKLLNGTGLEVAGDAIFSGDISGNSGDLNIVNSVDGSAVNIKIDDTGGTTQTGLSIKEDDFTTGGSTAYKSFILQEGHGIKIGDSGEFSANGGAPSNAAGNYTVNGAIINPTGNTWPSINLVSTGRGTNANPLIERFGLGFAGGAFDDFSNGNLFFNAANGTTASPTALGNGKRLAQVGFMAYDGAGYGGANSIPSSTITVTAQETAATDNARGANMIFDFLPIGGAGSDGDASSDRKVVLTLDHDTFLVGTSSNDVGSQFYGDATFEDNITVSGKIDGNTTFDDNVTVEGNLTAEGDLQVDGSITLGNTSSDNITVNARFQDHLISTNIDNLGEASNRWGFVYAEDLDVSIDTNLGRDLTVTRHLQVDGSEIDFTNLPTADPLVSGRLWRSGNDVKISTG